jgi:ubiquinone/menaquinone biosynthesis C-methylase UbiE
MENKIKASWNKNTPEYYQSDIPVYEEITRNPERAFPAAVYPLLLKYLGELRGKKILVPSSGDNAAVFGFHLLGASVTSCDFAENQLKHPQIYAEKQGWDIEFILQDSMVLDKISDNAYDLVYTSNGVHVWIDDMPAMYRNFHRVLKNGGYSIFFETHPMGRPFNMKSYEVKITRHYTDVYNLKDVPNYLWRTQDFVNAVIVSGFQIKEMQEFHSQPEDLSAHNYLVINEEHKTKYTWHGDTFDWTNNPWAALPQCLCLCSQKCR